MFPGGVLGVKCSPLTLPMGSGTLIHSILYCLNSFCEVRLGASSLARVSVLYRLGDICFPAPYALILRLGEVCSGIAEEVDFYLYIFSPIPYNFRESKQGIGIFRGKAHKQVPYNKEKMRALIHCTFDKH